MCKSLIDERALCELREYITRECESGRMSQKRCRHILEVEKMAQRLADIYLPEHKDALRAAALLHDLTKEFSAEEHMAIFEKYSIKLSEADAVTPKVWHAMSAAAIIPERFCAFATDEIVGAVRWHTTGHAGMTLCEKLGLDKEYYSVAIPLGATINMDGAATTITVMALTAAFSQGVEVNILLAILLSVVATLGACGASGVAGGSLLLIPMACSLLGIGQDVAMQMVGVGFIIGVIQDSVETALNSSGDVIFCATAEFKEWQKQGKELPF
jgi:hypothetical protein